MGKIVCNIKTMRWSSLVNEWIILEGLCREIIGGKVWKIFKSGIAYVLNIGV